MSEKIILDCDPGHDDAIALIMAVASQQIDLLGVTTSAGNQLPSKTLNNAMRVLTLLGKKDIPVAPGIGKPLLKDLHISVSMHGVTGLDGADLPDPNFFVQSKRAIDLMADLITQSKEPVSIVVTGPCTNVAVFLSMYPELKASLKQIVVLGGGMGVGNWQPTIEFNMLEDPEAAKIVLNSGVPIVMVPLNVAFQAQLLQEDLAKMKAIKNDVSRAVLGLLKFYGIQFNHGTRHFDGIPIYDPCCISWLMESDIFQGKQCHVDIETKGELTSGETIIDYYDMTGLDKNAFVLFNMNRERFASQVIDSLKAFS